MGFQEDFFEKNHLEGARYPLPPFLKTPKVYPGSKVCSYLTIEECFSYFIIDKMPGIFHSFNTQTFLFQYITNF
jgi:hypothetical protein